MQHGRNTTFAVMTMVRDSGLECRKGAGFLANFPGKRQSIGAAPEGRSRHGRESGPAPLQLRGDAGR